jgi:diketogulonate reductase-like aldo/keto reductase
VVQNRFVGQTLYDNTIRKLCKEHGIIYQSFWTLTGNPKLLVYKEIGTVAEKCGVSREVALYSLVLGLEGITVLNGTTNQTRMDGDLKGVEIVGKWAEGEGQADWNACLEQFKKFVGDVEA